MNSRERIIAALKRRPVDRLPVMEMGIDWAVMKGLGFSSYLDMIEGLDIDGAAVNQMLYVLGWRRWVLPHVSSYTDEWGVRSRLTGELLPIPVGHPIICEADLKGYRPPRPENSPLLRAIRVVRKRFPHRAVAMLSRNDFSAAWFLCGMDVLLMAFIESPGFAHRLVDMVNEYYCALYRLCINAGVDVIYLTDDYAFKTGTLMSRNHFQEFVLPALHRGVQAVHDAGGLCIKHTDGDISGIIDLIVGTGIDGLGPLEPAAGNDLTVLSRQWGDRVTLLGNVDVDLLCRGDVREVASVTRDLVRGMAGGRGYILSSGNTITASVNPLCFQTMVEEGKKAWTIT